MLKGIIMIDNLGDNEIKTEENLRKLNAFLEDATLSFSLADINLIKELIKGMDPQPEISLDHKDVLLVFSKSNDDLLSFKITSDHKILLIKNTYHEIIAEKQIEYSDIPLEVNLFYCN